MAESLKRKIEGTEEVGFIEKLKDALGLIPLKKKYLAKAEHVALPWEEEKKPVVRPSSRGERLRSGAKL